MAAAGGFTDHLVHYNGGRWPRQRGGRWRGVNIEKKLSVPSFCGRIREVAAGEGGRI